MAQRITHRLTKEHEGLVIRMQVEECNQREEDKK